MRWIPFLLLSIVPLAAQVAPPNDAGVSVGHVHLVVADPDAQKKLWVDLLGGELTSLPPLQLVKFPGILVVLQKAQNAPTDGSDGSTVNHFGFLVRSYADIKAKLEAQHLEFAMDNANNKQVIAVFPEKIRVEFTEDPSLKTPIAFHHFHVAATDQPGLRDWYVKTFAGRSGNRGNFPAAFVPGGEVDFLKANAAAAPTKGRSLDHIGFEVRNLEEYCKKLQAEGVTFDTQYRVIPQLKGLKIAYILDPIGTRIELTEGFAQY
jgi:catechol 2,3-dioxygenase-like lactoylglutathione lyase family enzyme